MKWVDEFFEEEECSLRQMADIENLLRTSSAAYMYDKLVIENLTHQEATEIIKDLKENDNPIDPREQFKRMFK
tara:strand:- start:683 stop:901 length:219 start_codon:yes stop_codon:yes gene_type:complete